MNFYKKIFLTFVGCGLISVANANDKNSAVVLDTDVIVRFSENIPTYHCDTNGDGVVDKKYTVYGGFMMDKALVNYIQNGDTIYFSGRTPRSGRLDWESVSGVGTKSISDVLNAYNKKINRSGIQIYKTR